MSKMASVKCQKQLCEDAPYNSLRHPFICLLALLDEPCQVSSSTVVHVKMDQVFVWQVFVVQITNNVGVMESFEDAKLGNKLLFLLGRHSSV